MGVETIALSQTLDAETWIETSESALKIHASKLWLTPLLLEYECDLSCDICYPVQQLDSSALYLAGLLHEIQSDSLSASPYAVEVAKVLSIYVIRVHNDSLTEHCQRK